MTHTTRSAVQGVKHSDSKGHIIDPTKNTKRRGSGKGNWGSPVDDIHDLEGVSMLNARRKSNSQVLRDHELTKFEEEQVLQDEE